jgi:hypothetical protein
VTRRTELILLGLIVVLAAFLRFSSLDLMEFKLDEAIAIDLAEPIFDTGTWPQHGLVSSIKMRNPPTFIYMMAIPMTFSFDPLVITGGLVGLLGVLAVIWCFFVIRPRLGPLIALTACLFFACSPWAVLYARKIWSCDTMPFFSVALIHALFVIYERRKSWVVAAIPILLITLWQIHFSAFGLMFAAGLLVLYRAREIRWTAFLAGTIVGGLLLYPYLDLQSQDEWRDLKVLSGLISGKRVDGKKAKPKKSYSLKTIRMTGDISGDTDLTYALCRHTDTCVSKTRYLDDLGSAGRTLASGGGWLGTCLMLLGFLCVLWRSSKGMTFSRSYPFAHLAPKAYPYWVLLFFIGGHWALFILGRLDGNWPHYYILLYPVPFILMAVAVHALWGLGQGERSTRLPFLSRLEFVTAKLAPVFSAAKRFRVMKWFTGGVAVVVVASHLFTLGSFARFLEREGGTAGDYGVVYRHKADLVAWAVQNGLQPRHVPGYEYHHLFRIAHEWGGESVLHREDKIDNKLSDVYTRVDAYNTLIQPNVAKRHCRAGWRTFGPLKACPRQ